MAKTDSSRIDPARATTAQPTGTKPADISHETQLRDSANGLLDEIEAFEDKVYAVTMAGVSYCANMDDRTCIHLFEVIQELLQSRETHHMLRERIAEMAGRVEVAA